MTEQTDCRWCREYAGLKAGQAKRLKELEKENARPRKAVADLTLDKLILAESTKGNPRALPSGSDLPQGQVDRNAKKGETRNGGKKSTASPYF